MVSEKLQYYTDQLATQAINNYRRSNGQNVLPSGGTVVEQRRQAATRAIEAPKVEEETYQQEKAALLYKFKLLREKEEKYELEAAQINSIESRRERIEAELAHYQNQRASLMQEIAEVRKAAEQLEAGKRELQLEQEAVDQEIMVFAIRKQEMQKEKEAFERKMQEGKEKVQREAANLEEEVAMVQSLRNELPQLLHSAIILTDRFTNRSRMAIRNGEAGAETQPMRNEN